MKITKSIYIKKFLDFREKSEREIFQVLKKTSSIAEGRGFINIEDNHSTLSGTYVYTSKVSREVFDLGSGKIKLEDQPILYRSSFEFEYPTGMFFAYCGGHRLSNLLTNFLNLMGSDTKLQDIVLDIPLFFKLFLEEKISLVETGILIHEFKPGPDLVGDFIAKSKNIDLIEKLLKQYESDISQIQFSFLIESGDSINLQLSKLGKITIKAEEDLWRDSFAQVKSLIMRTENG